MSDNEKRAKPKYEAPTVVPLGRLAKGAGAYCTAGTAAIPGYCSAGSVVGGSGAYCSAGTGY